MSTFWRMYSYILPLGKLLWSKKVRTVPSNMSKAPMSASVRPVTSIPRTDLSSWLNSRSLNKALPFVYGMIPG